MNRQVEGFREQAPAQTFGVRPAAVGVTEAFKPEERRP